MKQYNNHGITENYPQYTTNFWGSSADNNYGFGTSNIGNNIESMQTMTPIPHKKKLPYGSLKWWALRGWRKIIVL